MGTIIMWHKRERKLMKQATKSIKNFSLFTKNCNWEMKEAAKIKSTDKGYYQQQLAKIIVRIKVISSIFDMYIKAHNSEMLHEIT